MTSSPLPSACGDVPLHGPRAQSSKQGPSKKGPLETGPWESVSETGRGLIAHPGVGRDSHPAWVRFKRHDRQQHGPAAAWARRFRCFGPAASRLPGLRTRVCHLGFAWPRSCAAPQLRGPAGLGCVGPAAVRPRVPSQFLAGCMGCNNLFFFGPPRPRGGGNENKGGPNKK